MSPPTHCAHDGYHAISTQYDKRQGLLQFLWICERCGSRLGELGRETYKPQFDAHAAR